MEETEILEPELQIYEEPELKILEIYKSATGTSAIKESDSGYYHS